MIPFDIGDSQRQESAGNADNPPAEPDLAIETRPVEVAVVATARVADVDASGVITDPDEPVALVKPARAVHQERTLV